MFLHDAQERTESWQRRHSLEAIKQLGVWRWKGVQNNAALILNEITGKHTVDFGGKDAPLDFCSVVVDQGDDLASCWADVVFSSHTLEHIPDTIETLKTMYGIMERNGGCLILHVPSYTCERWRAGTYHNDKQSDHLHTFCLAYEDGLKTGHEETGFECIDRLVADAGFKIETAKYVGDDSILIIARRPA